MKRKQIGSISPSPAAQTSEPTASPRNHAEAHARDLPGSTRFAPPPRCAPAPPSRAPASEADPRPIQFVTQPDPFRCSVPSSDPSLTRDGAL